jgi:hypothetical protein
MLNAEKFNNCSSIVSKLGTPKTPYPVDRAFFVALAMDSPVRYRLKESGLLPGGCGLKL